MSNAQAAYYAWQAKEYRDTARLFRKFRYLASANALDVKADKFDRLARLESSEAPPVPTMTGPHPGLNRGSDELTHGEPPGDDLGDLFEPLA